ncbi:MAG: amidohydrolase [Clostridia bacterium]|nr:amidohydrolase [Clostridia bacterium]
MIIDFHTHPFVDENTNICSHKNYCNMTADNTFNNLKALGVVKICGSVIKLPFDKNADTWQQLKNANDIALGLKEKYGDFYQVGFHVHPDYVKESIDEIERMSKLGVKIVGELVPYLHGWSDYSCKAFGEIIEAAAHYNMLISFHSMDNDQMDKMVSEHKDAIFVAAHPGEYEDFMRHLARMKMSENYYLDLSGYGIFRHGMLRRGIDKMGVERFLFGSDYPTCNPAMYIGGVAEDFTLTAEEKQAVLYDNAARLLKL